MGCDFIKSTIAESGLRTAPGWNRGLGKNLQGTLNSQMHCRESGHSSMNGAAQGVGWSINCPEAGGAQVAFYSLNRFAHDCPQPLTRGEGSKSNDSALAGALASAPMLVSGSGRLSVPVTWSINSAASDGLIPNSWAAHFWMRPYTLARLTLGVKPLRKYGRRNVQHDSAFR